MRVPACLATVLLAGCSSLLGIQDPSPGGDGGVDAGIDADPSGDHLTISVGDFTLARGQRVRLRVQLVRMGGAVEDVTDRAMYGSDNAAIATAQAGTVDGLQEGTATITASLAGAASAAVKATVTNVDCHLVINELMTANEGVAANEYVEIYNPCVAAVDVSGWTLVYRGANTIDAADSQLMITLVGELQPGALRLYTGEQYPNAAAQDGTFLPGSGLGLSSGAIGLRAGPRDTGPLVDSVAYGTVDGLHPFKETMQTPVMASGLSASRRPFDGNDTGSNAADFVISTAATPRALNSP